MHPPAGMVPSLQTGSHEIRVRSRANAPINFAIAGSGGICSNEVIDPGMETILAPCGDHLTWNDGERVQTIPVVLGTNYEFSWANGHWEVQPLGH